MEEELNKITYLPWSGFTQKYPEGCELIKFHPSSVIFSLLANSVLKNRVVTMRGKSCTVHTSHNTKETFYAFKLPFSENSNSSTVEFYCEAGDGKLIPELRMRVNNTEFEHVRFSNPATESERISFKNSLI